MAKLARGRKRPGNSGGNAMAGIAMGLVGLLLLGLFIGGYWWALDHTAAIDPATNCPVSGPRAIHAVLVDRSDPISGQQAQLIKQSMQRMQDGAIAGERFDFFVFEGDTSNVLDPLLSVCAPGKPQDANAVYQNPEKIRKDYEEKFVARMNAVVDELVSDSERPTSPIMESLRAAAQWSFGPVEAGSIPLKLTLVSDMIQHSNLASHYKAKPDFGVLASQPVWAQLQPKLKGATVKILYLLRVTSGGNAAKIQNRGHQLFWEDFISASGGIITGMERL